MYYQKQKNNKLALVYEANIKANPLIAIDFEREFDLLALITKTISEIEGAKYPKDKNVREKIQENKKNNHKIAEYFKSIGVPEIKGSIKVKGELITEQNIQYNLLTDTYQFTDKLGNLIANAKNEAIIKNQISFEAMIVGEYKGLFNFFKLQTSVEGKVQFTAKGSVGIKLNYGVDTKQGKGVFIGQTLYCSGVEGTYSGKLLWEGIFEWSNEDNPTSFTLIEPFELPLYEVQLFNNKI